MSETERETESSGVASEAEMCRALAECEARLAEAASLAAHVRHDINNALTGLLGQIQLLLREDLSDSVRRRVLIIEESGTRIRDKVAELASTERPRT